MRYSTSAAAVALLATAATALPNNLRPRQTEAPAAPDSNNNNNIQPWVTIGDDGKPSTVTPIQTTIDGKPTVVSAAPNDLTATVFTSYSEAAGHTSTGTVPAAPTATSTDGQGSFLKCSKPKDANPDPFCQPLPWDVQEYRPGNTYYFTWDPTWFKNPNTTIKIQGDYINDTTGDASTTLQAFESSNIVASWGYWAWTTNRDMLQKHHAVNISISMGALKPGGAALGPDLIRGPRILLSDAPVPKPKPVPTPTGPALYIGLPVILGFALICIFGVCLWNARHRKIELGNIMSRGRHGYGINKSARSRMGLGGKSKDKKSAERVQLMERELASDGTAAYHDLDEDAKQMGVNNFPPLERPGRPRRDSDALGSLAGTPTENRQMNFQSPAATGGPNAFRDELKRQDGERF